MSTSAIRQLLILALTGFCVLNVSAEPVVTILSTDLSMDRDVDDWYDTFLYVQSPVLNPAGIVLEHYATDEVEAKTREFLEILGRPELPVVRGIQEKLGGTMEAPTHGDYGDGADFILDTMRQTEGKVRVIATGSLRNEAIAYHKDPALFLRKIERLYWAGGTLDGSGEANLSRDLLAAEIVFNAPIPLVWVPCTAEHVQKLSGEQEQRIIDAGNPVSEFLVDMMARWRAHRGEAFLKRTGQNLGAGKNLWSLPALLHAMGEGTDWMTWDSGEAHFTRPGLSSFKSADNGPDLVLTERNVEAICNWTVEKIVAFPE